MLIEVLVKRIEKKSESHGERYIVSTIAPEPTELSKIEKQMFKDKDMIPEKTNETFKKIEDYVGRIISFCESEPNELDYQPENIVLKYKVWTEES